MINIVELISLLYDLEQQNSTVDLGELLEHLKIEAYKMEQKK